MDLVTAVAIVANDQRESYPDLTNAEAIDHALNTISLADVEEGVKDDELYPAFVIVLTVRPSFCGTCGELEAQDAMTREASRWCGNGCGYDYTDIDALAAQGIRDAQGL